MSHPMRVYQNTPALNVISHSSCHTYNYMFLDIHIHIFILLTMSFSPPGSAEEREAVRRAYHHSSRRDKLDSMYRLGRSDDVEMSISAVMSPNATASFVFKAMNRSDSNRTVSVIFTAVPTYYTGASDDELKRDTKTMTIKAGRGKSSGGRGSSDSDFHPLNI